MFFIFRFTNNHTNGFRIIGNGVTMKTKINRTGSMIRVLTIISIIILSASMASAAEIPPNKFSGTVTLKDGTDAPEGTIIKAYIGGVEKGSIVVTTAGKYVQLPVNGDPSDDGAEITFTVGGVAADQTGVIWHEMNEPRILDLTTTGTPVPPAGSDDADDGGDSGSSGSSSGGFPPTGGDAGVDAGEETPGDTDDSSVPEDGGATSDAPSTTVTPTATDVSDTESDDENDNGAFPWLVLIIIGGLVVVAIIIYLMKK